jgi:type II secretory pathway component PulK
VTRSPRREEGFALVVVLIVLMIVAVVATDLAVKARIQDFLARNARNDLAVEEAARGWVEVVKARLAYDRKRNNIDSEDDAWAESELESASVGDVSIECVVEDEAGKFNLALLVSSDKNVRKRARKQFERLLVSYRRDTDRVIGASRAEQLAEKVVEYLEREDDGDYPVPEVGKDAPLMLTIDELRYVEGFQDPEDEDADLLYDVFREETEEELAEADELEPIPGLLKFCTLYSEGKININTAPVEVLRTLFENQVDWELADQIVEYRNGGGEDAFASADDEDSGLTPFESVSDLTKVTGIDSQTLSENGIDGNVVTVSSQVFSINVFATCENLTRQFRTIVKRHPKGFVTLLHEERKDPRYEPPEDETEE